MRGILITVALLFLVESTTEAFGQCAITPIPVGDGSTEKDSSSVDFDGDIAVIGDISDEPFGPMSGSVRVWRFSGSVWVEEAILTASNGAAEDNFGSKVAICGEVIAVGTGSSGGSGGLLGAAYIFRYNTTTMLWEEEAIITRQTAAPVSDSNFFGMNLALDGEVVAIAGSTVNGLGEDIMGAHIFRYNPVTFAWEFEQVVTINEPLLGGWFPNNWMALDGNVLIAGEPTGSTPSGSGAAWIYRYDGATWNLDVKIFSPSTDRDFFGIGVDVLGDMAVIGVPFSESPSGLRVGAVHIYEYDGASWNFTQKVVPLNTAQIVGNVDGNAFGISVSLAVNAMLVGALYEDEPLTLADRAGAVYHFKREGASWVEQGSMFAPDAMANDEFSRTGIAISGDRAIINSSRTGDVTGLGRAYIVDGFRGIGGSDCNNNGVSDYCEILDAVSEDSNTNGIPDECEAVLNAGQSAVINPAGSGSDPILDTLVDVTNITGADGSTIDVVETNEDLNPDANGYSVLGTSLVVNTTMADGEFFMTLTIPFDLVALSGQDWRDIDIVYFNTITSAWELAVAGNTANSPGFPGQVGDRFETESTLPIGLAGLSNDLGDYGVVWNPTTMQGFAWANADHVTDFSFGINFCLPDTNIDGSVNVTDLLSLLAAWGPNPGHVADINNDGNVNVTDLLALLAAWGACP